MKKRRLDRVMVYRALRSLCPVCQRKMALTVDGRVWSHCHPPMTGKHCPGSGQQAESA